MAIIAGAGSSTDAAFQFSGDSNTGIWQPSGTADTLAIGSGGAAKIYLAAGSGSLVGFGNTTPQKLSSNYEFAFGTDSGENISRLAIRGNRAGDNATGSLSFFQAGNEAVRLEVQKDGGDNDKGDLRFYTDAGTKGTPSGAFGIFANDGTWGFGPNAATDSSSSVYIKNPSGGSRTLLTNGPIAVGSGSFTIDTLGLGSASVTPTQDTGISINAGNAGAAMLVMAARNTSNGTATDAALYFIQLYFGGNNTPNVTFVSGDSNFVTWGVSGSNTLTFTISVGNYSVSALRVE